MFDEVSVEELAELAARRALSKLSARPAPSGELPVVLAGGSGGILFHEACGHGLEADHIVKDASVYTGRVGQQVASPLVTLVDDGTVGYGVGDIRRGRRRDARPSAMSSSTTGCSPTICGTTSGPARKAGCPRATAAARPTSTCPWSA